MTRSPVWHPFTQHALFPDATMIARTEGAWLETADGKRIFDAISSWWVITHGHRHPRIMAAIRKSTEQYDQIIFAGFTHEPAEKLAVGLIESAPKGLSHVFYSDSGSTSVEVALKMALGVWRNKGESRSRILALEGAYHGDTIGAMAVGERGIFNAPYEALLFDVERIPFPKSGREQQTFDALEKLAPQSAALIVEPLILGAGGMRIYAPSALAEMKRICERHGTLFIADEVMTGWGRTGTLYACDQAKIVPDIMCVAKGITGGALPLAATLCRSEIFDAHYSTDRTRTFFHSSSYTANPIACAAALANLRVWKEEPVLARIAKLSALQEEQIKRFTGDTRFSDARHLGTITALDLAVGDSGYLASIGPRLYRDFLTRGVLFRPLGNTLYIMPPYCTTPDELDLVYGVIEEVVAGLP